MNKSFVALQNEIKIPYFSKKCCTFTFVHLILFHADDSNEMDGSQVAIQGIMSHTNKGLKSLGSMSCKPLFNINKIMKPSDKSLTNLI